MKIIEILKKRVDRNNYDPRIPVKQQTLWDKIEQFFVHRPMLTGLAYTIPALWFVNGGNLALLLSFVIFVFIVYCLFK